jgi:hypothetical protein
MYVESISYIFNKLQYDGELLEILSSLHCGNLKASLFPCFPSTITKQSCLLVKSHCDERSHAKPRPGPQ